MVVLLQLLLLIQALDCMRASCGQKFYNLQYSVWNSRFFIIYMLWNARCMQHGPHKSGSSTKLSLLVSLNFLVVNCFHILVLPAYGDTVSVSPT